MRDFIFKTRVWPVIVLPGSYHADRQRTVSKLIQSFVNFVISFKRKLSSLKATTTSYTPCFLSNTFILAYFFSLTYKTSSFPGHSTQNKRYLSTSSRLFLKRMKETFKDIYGIPLLNYETLHVNYFVFCCFYWLLK